MAKKDDKKKEPGKKAKIIKRSILGFAAFVALLVFWGAQPIRGTLQYGVCKTFVELRLRYPQTFRLSLLTNFDQSLRLYFTYVDAYGEKKMDLVECTFRPDPQSDTGFSLDSIAYNRKYIPQEEIDLFNQSIDVFAHYTPDLIIPRQEDILKVILTPPEK